MYIVFIHCVFQRKIDAYFSLCLLIDLYIFFHFLLIAYYHVDIKELDNEKQNIAPYDIHSRFAVR